MLCLLLFECLLTLARYRLICRLPFRSKPKTYLQWPQRLHYSLIEEFRPCGIRMSPHKFQGRTSTAHSRTVRLGSHRAHRSDGLCHVGKMSGLNREAEHLRTARAIMEEGCSSWRRLVLQLKFEERSRVSINAVLQCGRCPQLRSSSCVARQVCGYIDDIERYRSVRPCD